ncbi:ribonuclease P protein component [Massilia brevitalea]|uniref:ribonuclease P protein component n=1 Tax=Massilia brevitalea TaxID=442526 RepID=UPI0027397AE5|nr:ribonuclease P protein component [Massilia brevitalea]
MTGEGSHDFARARRILKTDEFSSVFRLRPTQKSAHFVLYTRPSPLPHARLGIVAAKRFAPRAVTRNTIKRITRELFRTSEIQSVDCIVRLARPVNTRQGPATNSALKRLLHAELSRLLASQRPRKPAAPQAPAATVQPSPASS